MGLMRKILPGFHFSSFKQHLPDKRRKAWAWTKIGLTALLVTALWLFLYSLLTTVAPSLWRHAFPNSNLGHSSRHHEKLLNPTSHLHQKPQHHRTLLPKSLRARRHSHRRPPHQNRQTSPRSPTRRLRQTLEWARHIRVVRG